jgi:hypothetical protein
MPFLARVGFRPKPGKVSLQIREFCIDFFRPAASLKAPWKKE